MEEEIWKDIPGYEGIYQVSNFGNVKSTHRFKKVRCKILNDNVYKDGYSRYVLYKNGKSKRFKGHILVSTIFMGHKQDGHNLVVDHINGIKNDNRVSNLRIVTNRINCISYRKDRIKMASYYPGVSRSRNKWRARICIKDKEIFLGVFSTEEEAYKRYIEEVVFQESKKYANL